MILSPRYSGPTVVTIEGDPGDVAVPLVRQRLRLAELAATFTEAEWSAPSRCSQWSVRDVIAHIAGINPLYVMSAVAGLAGEPTRLMPHFDPAVSPLRMVEQVAALSSAQVLDLLVSSNAELIASAEALDGSGWCTSAESPLGEVPIRLVMSHALWDSWVHERDIVIPLGMTPTVVADEVVASLRYVAALTQGFAFGAGMECRGRFGIDATDPDFHCVMTVDDAVSVRVERPGDDIPVLRGPAVQLTEALSTRLPLPADAPPEWRRLLAGLEHTWDLASR
ncbi:maleylpyruvate isomerase family mycothiol-dependent enzyme [Mycobacterium gordonae]|uniref:maleylpyruvate isomerase family mycothiol-dependent enzyme n=1 Tax=Mycobacterium gordonae TaxID=1778 RepID=UPI00210993F5|nr:maleylpyruvate isomerase family mycothiol-dependent enzyme [Mycobacterium gordonae]MBX9983488.1 maleylpyruvate isomerase family mycothiol-dependent enzyme [Mycobacterium gordonae]MCQ4365010.1 maleylpyruvate isomerase family mycothiol-dependent enzyme [Mycobacterium gordonae]